METGLEVNPNKLILQQEQNSRNSSLLISNELAVIFVKGHRILKKKIQRISISVFANALLLTQENKFWKPQIGSVEFLNLV